MISHFIIRNYGLLIYNIIMIIYHHDYQSYANKYVNNINNWHITLWIREYSKQDIKLRWNGIVWLN